MPLFHYQALNDRGHEVSGTVAASSKSDLREELEEKGLLVQRLKKERSTLGLKLFKRRNTDAFLLYNQEFLALLRAGLTIPDVLVLAADQPGDVTLSGTLKRVLEDVRQGDTLSEACQKYPDTFENLYLTTIQTGEKTGELVKALDNYQVYLRRRVALEKKTRQALTYPMFLLFTLAAILGVLFAFVMPRFVEMYADFDAQLPLATRILVNLVNNLYLIAPAILIILVPLGLLFHSWWTRGQGRLRWDQIKERVPVLGEVWTLQIYAQMGQSLSMMLASGTALVEALETTLQALENRVYRSRLEQTLEQVKAGTSLAESLKNNRVMPPTAIKLVEVGETTGNLDGMLNEVALYYEELLESKIARVMALIEPVLMLLMGVLIGGIIIVMYLPIFHMAEVVR